MLNAILQALKSGFKVVGEIIGGVVQVFAKIGDILSRGKAKIGDQSLFEAASEWWTKIRENWLDKPINWINDKLNKVDELIKGLRENNPFIDKKEEQK